jgi:methanogenic corrinoid protein MtbC1
MRADRPDAAQPRGPAARVRREYLAALLAPDAAQARELVLGAVEHGTAAAEVYLRVLAPAMHDVGRLWERAEISVAQEHVATQITQGVLAQLAHRITRSSPSGAGRSALVACTPGERHALGAQMVADFLEADGWQVHVAPAGSTTEDLVFGAEQNRPDVVALSTALPHSLLHAARAFAALRRLPHRPVLVAGGQAYGADEARARVVGADLFGADPEALLGRIAERLAAH